MSLLSLPAGFNILLFYDDGARLFPEVLGRAGQRAVGTEAKGPQIQLAAHQCQLSLLVVGGFVLFCLPRTVC